MFLPPGEDLSQGFSGNRACDAVCDGGKEEAAPGFACCSMGAVRSPWSSRLNFSLSFGGFSVSDKAVPGFTDH